MTDDDLKRLLDGMRQENAAAHVETRGHFDSKTEETRGHFDSKVAETRGHFDSKTEETRGYFDSKTEEIRRHVDSKAEETQRHFDSKAEETQRHFDSKAEETRRHFEIVAEHLDTKIELLAEGVLQLGQKLDREAADIRDEMRRGFADTQAMIKFSHSELDRRVRALEHMLADLQARIERLEAATN
ncbi:MAG TPA: hypothetical protein VEZ11_16020 [Thermoanaerobaculia bacterium]|nr:hypothetical protein [Thermoanaerobaculia bacterium]